MDTGTRIKKLRDRRNWSQKYLADKVGLNNSVVNRIEKNKRPLTDIELKRFAETLETSSDYLLGMTEDSSAARTADDIYDDPETQIAYKEFSDASEKNREQAIEFLRWLNQQESGRKPGDRQKKN